MREMLRLQIESEHGLNQDSPDLKVLDRQRSILANQWHILILELEDEPSAVGNVHALEVGLGAMTRSSTSCGSTRVLGISAPWPRKLRHVARGGARAEGHV